MSYEVMTTILCDGDGCLEHECFDRGQRSGISRARRLLSKPDRFGNPGWRMINGKDYCPACVATIRDTLDTKEPQP